MTLWCWTMHLDLKWGWTIPSDILVCQMQFQPFLSSLKPSKNTQDKWVLTHEVLWQN